MKYINKFISFCIWLRTNTKTHPYIPPVSREWRHGRGSTETWTRIARFEIRHANPYIIEPWSKSSKHGIKTNDKVYGLQQRLSTDLTAVVLTRFPFQAFFSAIRLSLKILKSYMLFEVPITIQINFYRSINYRCDFYDNFFIPFPDLFPYHSRKVNTNSSALYTCNNSHVVFFVSVKRFDWLLSENYYFYIAIQHTKRNRLAYLLCP